MLKPKTVDDFIATQSDEQIEMLQEIRELIYTVAPQAEEVLSYSVPCFKLNGMLVGYGVQKKGISFYTMNPEIPAAFKGELPGYKFSGTTLHINVGQKMPVTVIKKIVKTRIKENEARAKVRLSDSQAKKKK